MSLCDWVLIVCFTHAVNEDNFISFERNIIKKIIQLLGSVQNIMSVFLCKMKIFLFANLNTVKFLYTGILKKFNF